MSEEEMKETIARFIEDWHDTGALLTLDTKTGEVCVTYKLDEGED